MKRRFKLKKAFSVMLVSYIAFLMVPAVLTFGLSMTANRLSAKQCIDDTMNHILRGKLLFEKQLDAMDSSSMQLTYDYALKWILQMEKLKPGDKHIYQLSEFQKRLKEMFADTSVFQDYSVLLKNEYAFNCNTMAQGREFYFEHYRRYRDMSYQEWLERSFYTEERTIFPMQTVDMAQGRAAALIYNYPIINNNDGTGEADAVAQFLIKKENLEDFFLPLSHLEGGTVFLLDKKGNRLAVLSEEELNSSIDIKVEDMTSNSGTLKVKNGTDNIAIVYSKSDKNDLIFAVSLPEAVLLKDSKKLLHTSMTMMVICMLFELMLGIYFAWKYTTPLRNLMRNVSRMMNPENAEWEKKDDVSEYESLESGINQIIETNYTMKSALEEKQKKERKNFLNYLLSGEFKRNEDIIREAALIGIHMGDMRYCVVSCPADEMTETIKDRLTEEHRKQVLAVHIMDGEHLAVLFGVEKDMNENTVMDTVNDMNQWIGSLYGKKIKMGIGRIYMDETDIAFSYRQSCYSAAALTKNPEQYAVRYSDILQDMSFPCYSMELEEKLINSTKCGEEIQIQSIFSYIRKENMEKRRLSKAMERVLVSNIAGTFLKIYNDVIPDEQVLLVVDMVSRYSKLSESLLYLEEQFIIIGGRLTQSKDERENDYQRRLAAYIEEHYSDSQLCIAMAAEEFTLSESYFSQFFKEIMGDVFSGYLETIRLGKAKSLIEEGVYDLEQISVRVGYNNSGTFRRAFKRVTGISPSGWKQRNNP